MKLTPNNSKENIRQIFLPGTVFSTWSLIINNVVDEIYTTPVQGKHRGRIINMDREKKVEDELYSFPSYLKSRSDCRTLTKRKLEQIICNITPELETYDNDVEIVSDLNLLAFLHHELGNNDNASMYISKSLSRKPHNINALVLKSWFNLKVSDIYESEKALRDIKTVCDDQIEVVHAKAELAYIYTRLGINFYDKAKDTFKVLFDTMETERITVDPKVMFIWKFRLILIRKRTLNIHYLTEKNKFDTTIERITKVFKNYSELLSIHQIDNKSRARLLVEMGELVHSANWKMPEKFSYDRSKMEIFERPATGYFEEALTYSDSDPFVLNRCGKHYKLKHDTVHKAIELLEKSIAIRETSFAHHHLALSLKRRLESSSMPLGAVGEIYDTTLNTDEDVDRSRSADNTFHLEPYADITSGFERMHLVQRRSTERRAMASMSNVGSNDRSTRQFNSYQCCGRHTRGQNNRFTYDRSQPRGRSAGKRAMAPMSDVGRNNWYRRPFNYGRQTHCSYTRFTGERYGKWDNNENTKDYIKSPSKMKYLDEIDKKSIDEILHHLDKAFDMSGNMSAVYDKGLTLRALRRYDEAIDAFKLFFGDVSAPSLVLLANAYEQSALCLEEKLEGLPQSGKTEKMNHNLKHYLHASIEICYKRIMPKYPDLKYCWSSPRILEEMLQKKDRTKENLSELHEFYSKIQMHSKDNKLLTELLEIEEDNDNRNVLYIEKIRNHCKLQNYTDAILTSSLMGDQMNDQPLFVEIHIEGGFQSYIKNENELAKLRFKSSFDKCRDIQTDVEGENKDTFQVFIVCSETNEDSPQGLKIGLESLGIDVTVNFEDLLIADSKSEGIVEVMKRSTHFVVFFEQKTTPIDLKKIVRHGEMIREVCLQRGYGNMVVVKRDEHVEVPITFADIPFVIYDDDAENVSPTQKLTEKHIQSLKGLLKKLVKNRNPNNTKTLDELESMPWKKVTRRKKKLY